MTQPCRPAAAATTWYGVQGCTSVFQAMWDHNFFALQYAYLGKDVTYPWSFAGFDSTRKAESTSGHYEVGAALAGVLGRGMLPARVAWCGPVQRMRRLAWAMWVDGSQARLRLQQAWWQSMPHCRRCHCSSRCACLRSGVTDPLLAFKVW
jgi:hypothetical protein